MRGALLVLKTFWSPGAAFKEIADARIPAWAPIIVLTVIGLISTAVITLNIDPGELALRALEQSPQGQNLSAEQKDRIVQNASQGPFRYIGFAFAFVGPIVLTLVLSGLYFGIFMILGSSASFRTFFSLTAFAQLPLLIRNIAAALMVLLIPSSALSPQELGGIAVSTYLDPTKVSRTVFTAAQSFDLITFWVLILSIIAYGNVAPRRMSIITRSGAVLSLWVMWVGGRVLIPILVG